jgi:hypothetical protein
MKVIDMVHSPFCYDNHDWNKFDRPGRYDYKYSYRHDKWMYMYYTRRDCWVSVVVRKDLK